MKINVKSHLSKNQCFVYFYTTCYYSIRRYSQDLTFGVFIFKYNALMSHRNFTVTIASHEKIHPVQRGHEVQINQPTKCNVISKKSPQICQIAEYLRKSLTVNAPITFYDIDMKLVP